MKTVRFAVVLCAFAMTALPCSAEKLRSKRIATKAPISVSKVNAYMRDKQSKERAPSHHLSVPLESIYGSRTDSEERSTEEPTPDEPVVEPPKPFHYFDANDDGDSIINAYLLSVVSMAMYSEESDEDDFEEELRDKLLPMGASTVDVVVNGWTGTECGIITTEDAIIIAFRGTSSAASSSINPFEDVLGDLNALLVPFDVGGLPTLAHTGFIFNAGSTYPTVLDRCLDAAACDKKVWLTGHSLGAANATITASRLHYNDGIEVQGLHTFGSPMVGASLFAMATALPNKIDDVEGKSLYEITQRWIFDGDPIPLYPVMGKPPIGPYVPYMPTGITNKIHRYPNGVYEIKENTNAIPALPDLIDGAFDEHMDYENALRAELIDVLTDNEQFLELDVLVPSGD